MSNSPMADELVADSLLSTGSTYLLRAVDTLTLAFVHDYPCLELFLRATDQGAWVVVTYYVKMGRSQKIEIEIGTGQGMSHEAAKESAAEDALSDLASRVEKVLNLSAARTSSHHAHVKRRRRSQRSNASVAGKLALVGSNRRPSINES